MEPNEQKGKRPSDNRVAAGKLSLDTLIGETVQHYGLKTRGADHEPRK